MTDSEYTPTLGEIRDDWAHTKGWAIDPEAAARRDDRLAMFDRAVAAHDAEVRAQTRREALDTEAHPWEILDFREAWEAANARYEVGTRLRQGLAAMLTRRATLLAERLGAGVVAEEPEWEYGIHSEISGNVNSVGAPWMDREFAEKVTANDSRNYGVRRRKAGPWVPVKQEAETGE